jgi:outer membrane murein-binding lipoprotein Lpp
MNPVSVFKTKAVGAKMISRRMHRQDDAEAGCQAISLVSYLEAANEKLRQTVSDLTRETAALRQELEQMDSRGHAAEAEARRRESNGDP